MSFKNALRNLVAHFGVVWSVLLYMVIFTVVLLGLSIPFVFPIARALADAGVFDGINKAFSLLFAENGWNNMWAELYVVYGEVVGVFTADNGVASLTMSFLIFVVVIAFRFFFGLYEIPLATVIDGRMSCNARYGLGGKFFSSLWVSVRYSLAKMPVMILFDAATFGTLYGLSSLIGINVALPFVVIFVLVTFRSFRSGMLACWAPSVVNGYGIIRGFARSVKFFFKRFGTIYSTYLVTWILIIAVCIFLIIFTLGVGMIIALPLSTVLLSYVGMTEYYNKTGRRYYIDGTVFTPPTENVL